MAKATYENIGKLCSDVFSRKQTLQFALATTASCDVSIQLLFIIYPCFQFCPTICSGHYHCMKYITKMLNY